MARVVCAHNDLLLEVAFRAREDNPFGSYWLPHLETGGVALQVCPMYSDIDRMPEGALRHAIEQVVAWQRAGRENSDRVALVRSRGDLDAVASGAKIGLVLSVEGAEMYGYDVGSAEAFWELGVRMVGLTWNRRNQFADGLGESNDGGLSSLGRQLVAQLAELGTIMDLSHASPRTFEDVLDLVDGTVIVSHAGCRALLETPRNLTDDQLRAIAERRGVVGMMAIPGAIDPEVKTLDRFVDHIAHACEAIGVEHVGIGGDFVQQLLASGAVRVPADVVLAEGAETAFVIDGLAGPEDFQNLAAALERRGFADDERDAVLAGNWLRVLGETLPA
ncbi:MAG: dipeptidase [Gaiellaceae bacterium]